MTMIALIMDRNFNAAENIVVDQELQHIRGFICGCRCFDDGPCCQQFMDWEIVDSPNECKGDDSQTEGKLYLALLTCFAVVASSVSLMVTLNSLTMTCHDSQTRGFAVSVRGSMLLVQ